MSGTHDTPSGEPDGLFESFHGLIRRPEAGLAAGAGRSLRLAAGAVFGCAAYGLCAGLFQGGAQVAVAAIKSPLIVAASVLLCAPSL